MLELQRNKNFQRVTLIALMAVCLSLVVLMSDMSVVQANPAVEEVKVQVVSDSLPPVRVVRRLTESVKTIGEHLLLGRSSIDIAKNQNHYQRLVREVFDRVLIGYLVNNVEIVPGRQTEIRIFIVPWGDTVRSVKIKTDYTGIAPEASHLIKQDIEKIEKQIEVALLGLPVDAVDWASSVARDLVRELLQRQLPEFHFSLDVEAGKETSVRLSLFPTGQLVKEVKVSLRSTTIPNLLLVHARPAVELQARSMRGLPVAYVERRLNYFITRVQSATQDDPLIQKFGLSVKPQVRPGTDTEVQISVESGQYRVWAEAWLEVGQNQDNIAGKAHIGTKIGSQNELFLELKLLPGTMTWEVMPGLGRQFAGETWAGVRYRTNDKEWVFWLEQGLGGRWSLRVERWPGLNLNEVGLRYKLHDFLSAEFVMTNTRNWLRMVGHL